MYQQIRLRSIPAEEAIDYCERHGIAYQVLPRNEPRSPGACRTLTFRLSTPRFPGRRILTPVKNQDHGTARNVAEWPPPALANRNLLTVRSRMNEGLARQRPIEARIAERAAARDAGRRHIARNGGELEQRAAPIG